MPDLPRGGKWTPDTYSLLDSRETHRPPVGRGIIVVAVRHVL